MCTTAGLLISHPLSSYILAGVCTCSDWWTVKIRPRDGGERALVFRYHQSIMQPLTIAMTMKRGRRALRSSSAALPASPLSKSPLLMRIVSMKHRGIAGVPRKRASTVSSENRNQHANGNARPTSSGSDSGAHASPPPVFQALEEEDRMGNNRTPRLNFYIQSSPPAAPMSPKKSHGHFLGTYAWLGRG